MDLNVAYTACAEVTKREARNFYYAFLSLPKAQRQAIYALYAFCREADDVVDAAFAPSSEDAAVLANKRDGLAQLRERLTRAAAGNPIAGRDIALADAIERFGVDPNDLANVLVGMEMDLTLSRFDTTEELDRYCYHAASAVGLATLPILNSGVPPTDAMRDVAIDLGLGMQYVNILRDIAEDLDRDRIYLPREALNQFGIDEHMLKARTMSDPLRSMLAVHANRARSLLDSGRRLIPMLPRRGRSCPWLLSEIYGRILARISMSNYDVFAGRVSLPKIEKVGLLVSTVWRRL